VNKEEYKHKLQEFNNTEKYKLEQDFLIRLLKPQSNERILDYGTGLGRLVYYLNNTFGTSCYGYDLYNLREEDCEFWFRKEYYFKFHKVFFMHSIAHIPDIEEKLRYLQDNLLELDAKIYAITPNKSWLSFIQNIGTYVSDSTIIEHFTSDTLRDLFTKTGFKIINEGQFGAIQKGQHERLFIEATNEK
jgi:hypothetical protein